MGDPTQGLRGFGLPCYFLGEINNDIKAGRTAQEITGFLKSAGLKRSAQYEDAIRSYVVAKKELLRLGARERT